MKGILLGAECVNQFMGKVQSLEHGTLRSCDDDPGLVMYSFNPVMNIPGGGDFSPGHLTVSPRNSALTSGIEDLPT